MLIIIKLYASYRSYGAGSRAGGTVTAGPPLLSVKDDDLSSWGSSYDSLSEDEEKLNDAVAILNGKQQVRESNNDRHSLCILCLDRFRDCFFLPCGHCASCFTCGGRLVSSTLVSEKPWKNWTRRGFIYMFLSSLFSHMLSIIVCWW